MQAAGFLGGPCFHSHLSYIHIIIAFVDGKSSKILLCEGTPDACKSVLQQLSNVSGQLIFFFNHSCSQKPNVLWMLIKQSSFIELPVLTKPHILEMKVAKIHGYGYILLHLGCHIFSCGQQIKLH